MKKDKIVDLLIVITQGNYGEKYIEANWEKYFFVKGQIVNELWDSYEPEFVQIILEEIENKSLPTKTNCFRLRVQVEGVFTEAPNYETNYRKIKSWYVDIYHARAKLIEIKKIY